GKGARAVEAGWRYARGGARPKPHAPPPLRGLPFRNAEAPSLAANHPARAARPRRPLRRVGGGELLLVLERRQRREQAARSPREGGAREAERPAALPPVEHPRPPNGQRSDRAAGGSSPFGLDHARAERPEAPPDRVPLDPAGHGRLDSRRRHREDQRRDAVRRARARDPDRPRPDRASD